MNVSVWARAITDDVERVSEIKRYANVLIWDEVSMMSEGDKEKIFELKSTLGFAEKRKDVLKSLLSSILNTIFVKCYQ